MRYIDDTFLDIILHSSFLRVCSVRKVKEASIVNSTY